MPDKIRKKKQTATVIIIIILITVYAHALNFSAKPAEISVQQSVSVSENVITIFERIFGLTITLSENQFADFEKAIRKTAHFLEYALIGLLLYLIPLIWNQKSIKTAALSFLIVVFLAAIDETLQLFIPGRAGLITDVVIDSFGCLTGMLIIKFIYEKIVSRNSKTKVSRNNFTK
ncbi:MAG: VanZ family protein [Lachnospiraceae bacterium]|nr:VanZ family protein [Lachnospiraceae bacterium]